MPKVPVPVDQGVVCVGLGEEVCGTDCTIIRIGVAAIKQITIELLLCNGSESIIKCQVDYLNK